MNRPAQPCLLGCRWRTSDTIAVNLGAKISFLALLTVPITGPFLWPVTALAGAAYFGIYTSALSLLGQTCQGSLLVAGSAAFSLEFALGGIVGPIATGAAPERLATLAFVLLIGISAIAAATVNIARRRTA